MVLTLVGNSSEASNVMKLYLNKCYQEKCFHVNLFITVKCEVTCNFRYKNALISSKFFVVRITETIVFV